MNITTVSRRLLPLVASASLVVAAALAGCAGSSKTYDIHVLWPASPDSRCAQYDGTVEGSGLMEHCWVTLDECKKAVADYDASDAYDVHTFSFRCD